MASFEEYAVTRRRLRDFCAQHESSLLAFRDGISFLRDTEESINPEKLRHLTSSATCLESLGDVQEIGYALSEHNRKFAVEALAIESWISDDSAEIYCRCRALPFVITWVAEYNEKITTHLKRILHQLKTSSSRFGIGEGDEKTKKEDWYPPNGYHTYWTLQTIENLKERFEEKYNAIDKELGLAQMKDGMVLWAKQTLAYQVSLHAAKSSLLDTDQLAWCLCIFTKFGRTYQSNLIDQDFLRFAFKCLFSTQNDIGTWRHYQPLFHYRTSGNAYCYVFETFAVLTSIALRQEAEFLRRTLKIYFQELIRLFDYAVGTAVVKTPNQVGWSSGHRKNHQNPESWATASVFSFVQHLRRLVGVWTKEEALSSLPRIQTKSAADGETAVFERGDTWVDERNQQKVSESIFTMFINPVRMSNRSEVLDSDRECIDNDKFRSAILFGPPGASKTTLAQSLAAALQWDYVELHASHFVADGLPNVQKTADAIFQKLMEIDRAVVLFDEVDELVRERDDGGTEAFGRFLTTSMLPKVAEIWKQRKIIYLVATNHIELFDQAITRSERFDALIFTPPPSYEAKISKLKKEIQALYGQDCNIEISQENIEEVLRQFSADLDSVENEKMLQEEKKKKVEEVRWLAKFALIRWDQIPELAIRLGISEKGAVSISSSALSSALGKLVDSRLNTKQPYLELLDNRKRSRFDLSKFLVWEVKNVPEGQALPAPFKCLSNGTKWLVAQDLAIACGSLAKQFKSSKRGVLEWQEVKHP